MTISRKVGLHVVNGTIAPLGKPTVVKLVDPSVAYYQQVRAEVGPDCLIVVRWYHAAQPLDNPTRNAAEWYYAHEAWLTSIPTTERVVYEGWNEVGDTQAVGFSYFETERLRWLHAIGRRGCVGNFSVGTPDLHIWPLYAPMLAVMVDGDCVGLHEYWSDRADIENLWHVRRFTLPAVAANVGNRRIVITECGRDVVEGLGQPGWQHTTDAAGYLDDLRRLGELYDGCANVIGATVFQTGALDARWAPFNVYGLWPQVVGEYGAVMTPPIPPGGSMSIPYFHSSRGAYRITDIVIHDTEGSAEAAEYWFRAPNNTSLSSAHVIVDDKGVVMRLIPDELSAHHAGYATIPGREGVNPNRFTLGIELEYPKAPLSPPWPEAQLVAAADVVREWCETWDITAEHIWEHKTIDPTRRSDPRNWDRAAFLRRVFPPVQAEPLPNDEQGSPQTLAQKARWWAEEMQREFEAGNLERAQTIRLSLIDLLYRLENELT